MQFRINRFFLDEKDIFVICYWLLVISLGVLKISVYPFKHSSLIVVLFFLLITRSLVSNLKFNSYFFIILSGLLFSMWLSPYGVAIYLFIAILLYTKTNLI